MFSRATWFIRSISPCKLFELGGDHARGDSHQGSHGDHRHDHNPAKAGLHAHHAADAADGQDGGRGIIRRIITEDC